MRAGVRSADNELAKKTIIVSAKAITSQNLTERQKLNRESIVTKIPFLRAPQLDERPPTALWWENRAPKRTQKAVSYGNAMLASWPNLYRTFSNHFWYFALLKNSCEPSNVFEF